MRTMYYMEPGSPQSEESVFVRKYLFKDKREKWLYWFSI